MKFQKGNQAAAKSGFEKKMRIRVPSEADSIEIERWLPDPESRGRALIAAAYERQSIWMDANMSDDLIDEYEESDTDLDPKEWFEKRTK